MLRKENTNRSNNQQRSKAKTDRKLQMEHLSSRELMAADLGVAPVVNTVDSPPAAISLWAGPSTTPTSSDMQGSTIAQAANLSVNQSVSARIDRGGDVDMFRVRVEAGQAYTFATSLGSLDDSVLTMYDASGRQIAMNDDGGNGLASRIQWRANFSGDVYLSVRGYSGSQTGSYILSASGPADDHGDVASQATRLSVGGSASGRLESSRDVDVFRVDVRQGSVYEFNTTLGSLRDTTLTLRDAAGNRIAFDDDGGNGLASRIRFTATQDGPVYLTVDGYGDQTGDYRISASMIDDRGSETGSARSNAIGARVSGNLERAGDVDTFRFDVRQGAAYRFETQLGSLRDSVITLVDSAGNRLASNDDGGNGLASRLDWTARHDGPVFVQVRGYSDSQTGTYTLQSSMRDDYSNQRTGAQSVSVGSRINGNIETGGDNDVFRLQARRGTTYTLETSLGSLRDSVITLTDASGRQLAFDDDGGDGLASRITWTATQDGPVFLTVRGYSGSQTGTYSLTVSESLWNRDQFFANLRNPIFNPVSQVEDALNRIFG